MSSATYGHRRCVQCWGQVLFAAMKSQSPFSMISRESAYAVFLRSPRYFYMLPGNILCCDHGGRMKNFANVILDHGLSP